VTGWTPRPAAGAPPGHREVIMILEIVGSALVGLGLALAASRLLSHRLPAPRFVLPAGPLGALFGSFVTHAALGPGYVPATLIGAAAAGAVLISLMLRPAGEVHRALP
jgi:hypothetical protein